MSFDELAELILVKEARDVEPLVQRARSFAEKCDDGQAVIKWFQARGCGDDVTRTDASACLLDCELEVSSLGALILAERLDINRDGVIDEKDALAWLVVPRKHEELREQLQRWCISQHQSQPKVCFDALDRRGRGLASRRDLEKVLCWEKLLRRAFTRTELDVILTPLDADGSGCVDVQEFTSWLSQGRSDFVDEEEGYWWGGGRFDLLVPGRGPAIEGGVIRKMRTVRRHWVGGRLRQGPGGAGR